MKKYILTILGIISYFTFGITSLEAREIYAPDGTTRTTTTVENQLGFNSSYHDDESNLVYKRARYYSSNQGRFISRDPLGYVDGTSLYAGYFGAGFNLDPMGLKDTPACRAQFMKEVSSCQGRKDYQCCIDRANARADACNKRSACVVKCNKDYQICINGVNTYTENLLKAAQQVRDEVLADLQKLQNKWEQGCKDAYDNPFLETACIYEVKTIIGGSQSGALGVYATQVSFIELNAVNAMSACSSRHDTCLENCAKNSQPVYKACCLK